MNRFSSKRRLAHLVMVGAILTCAGYSMGVAAAGRVAQVGATTPDGDAQAQLFSALVSEVSNLPATASPEDFEASIVFVMSQSSYSPETIMAGLNQLSGRTGETPALRKAVQNVRYSFLYRKWRRGTAALLSGSASSLAFGYGFSAPIVSIGGGGSSNYAQ